MHLHFTPTSASWRDLVECWLAPLTTRRLARGASRGTRALEQATESYVAATNADPRPFVWTETADEILESVARSCRRTPHSHH